MIAIVRRIGALQILREDLIELAITLIQERIDESLLDERIKNSLTRVLRYFKYFFILANRIFYSATWINGPLGFEFFSAWNVDKYRTTNHAESYHSHLQAIFEILHPKLGVWLVLNQDVTGYEEERAKAAIAAGSSRDREKRQVLF